MSSNIKKHKRPRICGRLVTPPSEYWWSTVVVWKMQLLTLTFQPKYHITSRISQDHFLHQVWTLLDLLFLSYALDKETNRRTRASYPRRPTLLAWIIMVSINLINCLNILIDKFIWIKVFFSEIKLAGNSSWRNHNHKFKTSYCITLYSAIIYS